MTVLLGSINQISICDDHNVSDMVRFLRDVIFEVFAVNWLSFKISSLNFFDLHQSESRILGDSAEFVTSSKFTCLKNLYVCGM